MLVQWDLPVLHASYYCNLGSPEYFTGTVLLPFGRSNINSASKSTTHQVEYMKRLAREAAAASNPMLSPQVHRMAQQVQEVLPHISLDQIKRDLGQS